MATSPKLSLTYIELYQLASANNIDLGSYNGDQVMKGIEVELEHGVQNPTTDVTRNNALQTLKIVLAHLDERPNYYNDLEQMEKKPLQEDMMNIHEIASQLVQNGAVSSEDFEILGNELVPKDEYTANFILSEIKALGYDAILKDGKILLTGETIVKNENIEEKPIEEIKENISEVAPPMPDVTEQLRNQMEIRRQVENIYNQAEDFKFQLMDYQDNGMDTKSFQAGIKSVMAVLQSMKNQLNGPSKPSDPSVDF